MNDFNILRLEVNYLLSTLDYFIGSIETFKVKEALHVLIDYFFFHINKDSCIEHVELVEQYIEEIAGFSNTEYRNIKKNVPAIIQFVSIIKQEQSHQ